MLGRLERTLRAAAVEFAAVESGCEPLVEVAGSAGASPGEEATTAAFTMLVCYPSTRGKMFSVTITEVPRRG